MPSRTVQYRKLRKQSIGDMRDRISLEERTITAPIYGSSSFTEYYNSIATVWAKVETEFYMPLFDGVSIENKPSHKISIRYRDDITYDTRIRFDDILYKIDKIDNTELRNEYLILYASIAGDDDQEASQ